MYNNYKCPKCHGNLRLGHNIILSAIKKTDKTGMIILLHPELGNYSADYHPESKFEKGDAFTLYCPICHHDLSSSKHKNLAMVIMTGEDGKQYDIYFSQVAGEQSTVKMLGEHVELFGPDAEKYFDYFDMSLMH